MTVITTSVTSNSVQALYQAEFVMAAKRNYVYSQSPLAFTPAQGVIGIGNRGSSVNIPVFHRLAPSTTALSQTADVTPVTFTDDLITVTPEMYGQAVQLSQKLSLEAFTDVEQAAVINVAEAAADARDRVARIQACSGAAVVFGGDATTRLTVGTGSSSYEMGYSDWLDAVAFLQGARAPMLSDGAGVAAIISDQTYADQIDDGTLILVGEYSAGAYPFLLNGEIGTHIAGVRVIKSNFAKIFHGAGASNVGGMESTIVGSTTTLVAGATSMGLPGTITSGAVGDYVAVGTVEATGVADPLITETVMLIGATNSTTQAILGGGPNGGFVYPHAAAAPITAHAQVHAAVFMTAEALAMVYTNDDGLGPDGLIIPPENTGLLKQFNSMGYKHFLGFARASENRLWRVEHEPSRTKIGD
jgi:N4-gp56 family major capsid protein